MERSCLGVYRIGSYVYEGEFQNGLRDGYCREDYGDGSYYLGQKHSFIKAGRGMYVNKFGKVSLSSLSCMGLRYSS